LERFAVELSCALFLKRSSWRKRVEESSLGFQNEKSR
jgi:hypothetical protein